MEQKQYDAMQIIMQCSRAFADQMGKCLTNSGLMDKGFKLEVTIGQSASKEHGSWSNIELSEYLVDVGEEQYKKTRMEQWKLGSEEEWSVRFDPKAEAGTIPQIYGSKTTKDDCERVAEVSEHPYPPDNMWISSRDDYPVLGGG